MIAATTESPDGRTKSSMSYSSSNSSSSTMTSTIGGGPGGMSMGMPPMRGMGMQMPQMPSLGGKSNIKTCVDRVDLKHVLFQAWDRWEVWVRCR